MSDAKDMNAELMLMTVKISSFSKMCMSCRL
jgi:hypothetical protein